MSKVTARGSLCFEGYMGKLIKLRESVPLRIFCERCFEEIGEGFTYGYLFYCDECMRIIERAKAVEEMDTD